MPILSSGKCDLRELAHLLRNERLFIRAEQELVEQLNAQVASLTADLSQEAWISSQQRRNLQLLVLAHQDCLPALQNSRSFHRDRIRFRDAGPVLGYSETTFYGNMLAALRNSPELLAGCLAAGDKSHPDRVPVVLQTVSAGLYGSCLLAADKRLLLRLLRQLAIFQLAPSDNPRRLLRHGTCAFARLFSTFHVKLHTAQLFLTAALHDPIMALLAEDEELIDLDPEKSGIQSGGKPGDEERRRRLIHLTNHFMAGLRDNLHCFPPSISWLLRQLAAMLTKAGFLNEKEVYEICTDLLLTHFICPAIVNPEPHGIIEAPVNSVARLNLIKVAQILQNLAMTKYESWDAKVKDLYSPFDLDCVSRIICNILESGADCVDVPLGGDSDLEEVSRATILISSSQLNALVSFLQTVLVSSDEFVDRTQLELILNNVPPVTTNGHKDFSKPRHSDSSRRTGILGKAVRQRSNPNGDQSDDNSEETVEVLVVRLPGEPDGPELLSEAKVLEMEGKPGKHESAVTRCVIDAQDLPDSAEISQSQEKRTRFSLSHDEGSIGNTSDNLEAISEAASNHSGASSLESEGEDHNDNLSDMVSANVSGRGSPNISGRDTPSSQITEGEVVDRPILVPPPVSKQTRSDIEDKFGKFEIKKQEVVGDETVSLVSDTWSTDVLASDSELVGDVDRFQRHLDDGPPHPLIQHSLDISETASEAWSTDVMASDSERMTEVDTDDTASVAPSDDTAASETGGRGDEPGTPPPVTFRPAARLPRSDDTLVLESGGRVDEPGTPPAATFRPTTRLPRSDDTVVLESGGRIDEPGTPPAALFRPIARLPRSDDAELPRMSLAVPPSPTRSGDPTQSNVTGRGGAKADYKRRTLEFVGAVSKPHNTLATLESPRMIHVIDKMDSNGRSVTGRGGGGSRSNHKPPLPQPSSTETEPLEASVAALSLASDNDDQGDGRVDEASIVMEEARTSAPPAFHAFKAQNFVIPPKFPEPRIKPEVEDGDRVFRSSTSLASTSSSSSNAAGAPLAADPKLIATGAIPKSISFDKTADKEFLDDKTKKKSFFGNLKMSFKNRKIKKGEGSDGNESSGPSRVRRVLSEDSRMHNGGSIEVEDILAKYRGKAAEDPDLGVKRPQCDIEEESWGLSEEGIFLNAKRKLRIVFSRSELQSWPSAAVREKELDSFLLLQLAEARNLQNRDLVSQLHETLRCVRLFDADGCRRLIAALRSDIASRSSYTAYLTRMRQILLSRAAHLTRLTDRLRLETRLTEVFLIALCVRLFLERREDRVRRFSLDFRGMTLGDDKTDLLNEFLAEMAQELDRDPAWQGASEDQRNEAQTAVETAVLSRVFPYAFYPNGEADVSRDLVFHEHMKKLATIITPNHKDLQIPKRFHGECPWPSAQAEISALASFKTPRDKAKCVTRCADTIMNLLALSSEGTVAAADEFLPVFVYVIIAANPPALQSTVQYVNCFSTNLDGEDLYYWTQFCSAIVLITKMVDNM